MSGRPAPSPRAALGSRLKLEWSVTVSTVFLVMVLNCAVMVVVHFHLKTSLREALDTRGVSMAQSIGAVATPSLLAYNYAALQIAAHAASHDEGVAYVVIHDKEGVIAGAQGRRDPPPPVAGLLAESRLVPIATSVLLETESDGAVQVREAAVAVRVEGSDLPWGTVRVGLETAPMVEQLWRLDLGLLALGIGLALLAAICARWVARQITAPLRRLARGTEALAEGEMHHRIAPTGARELADLASAFNEMMGRLQEKAFESDRLQRQLASLNLNLEQKVFDRTRALQESEAQYKTLVEHSPDAILIVQSGRVRFVNPVFEKTFGVPREAATSTGFDLLSVFDPDSAEVVRSRIAEWERGGRPVPVEVKARDAGGAVRILELRGSGIEYLGRPAAECLLIDATEAVALRERLGETERLRSLGELAGGVAHDFNNLLGAILGRAQLLRRKGLDTELDADIAVVERAALDGRETVRRIQEFSRVRRDRSFSPVKLDGILHDSVEMTRSRWKADAESRNARIEVVLDTDAVPPIMGSPAELRELFINLILNGVDAMPEGGRLSISCRREGDRVVAEAGDTGVGMTDEVRRHLFNPFFTTKGVKGMGLGLSVVYGIVARHDGTIEVRSIPGHGTTFVVSFPACAGAEEEAPSPVETRAALASPSRILVIDDELEIAVLLRDILATQGHTVEMTTSPREGVRLAQEQPFALVLTDLGMPELSGWEVAEAIRAARPEVPVALVTGWAASIEESRIREHRIAALVHKPFEVSEILSVTAELLAPSFTL